MFIRFSSLLPIAALVAVAAADSSQCNTGSQQCCVMTQTVRFVPPHAFALCADRPTLQSNPTTLNYFSGLLGIALPTIDGLLGLGCSPITAIGTGTGATCTQQPVCCTDNTFVS